MGKQKYTNEDYERELQERYYGMQRKSLLARQLIANGMGLKASVRKVKKFEKKGLELCKVNLIGLKIIKKLKNE